MQALRLWSFLLCLADALGSDTTGSLDNPQFTTISGILSIPLPGTSSLRSSQTSVASTRSSSLSTISTTTEGSTSTITLLVGGGIGVETATVINGTTTLFPNVTTTTTEIPSSPVSSTTIVSPEPTNTQPCNGWVEFCERSYSNITHVAAHNAPFAVKSNAASNQKYSLTVQLNDGVRMLTTETQSANGTIFCCHTSCDLLNAGTLLSKLQEVSAWVRMNPYDVVTLLLVNSEYRPVEDYIASIQDSGLAPYFYVPPKAPLHLKDWPTLSSMILSQKRVVIFMDYNANQTSVPYVLDQYAHMWETPFSPQDMHFPCTLQRPPSLTNLTDATENFMYLANHNLNAAVNFEGQSFLIPNVAAINNTNAAGYNIGMMGAMASDCQAEWSGRPPNWLVVDFYNTNGGSVFEVAARMNNVTWNRSCCGIPLSNWASRLRSSTSLMVMSLSGAFAWLYI
ncbi:PLC-like phosphodiesterase [Myriangium duriaei CBS 260.36]|uniref:PLC-like phosphodiesterase n=1 Tax=Myriangium duriaei CBS 260.36 TaxID=1168546 RepID=A0A9P4IYV4_9PEZI|nr:PLC-like phosphodiesterase [Myriangium duriaei CBS 260.36]